MSGSVRSSLRHWLRVERLEDRTTPTAVLDLDPTSFATGRVLVTASDVTAVSQSPLASGVESLGFGVYSVHLRAGVGVPDALSALGGVPGVRSVEPDYTIGVTATPDDTSYGSLWGLNNTGQSGGLADADIDAAEAWDTAKGTGEHIVAVIDTGVDYTHPDLTANMWTNSGETAGDGVDNDGNGVIDDIFGADYVNNDGNPMDDNNHGTHVAGTIGATGNNAAGVVGVAWTTRIMAVKFLSASGSGSLSNAVKAINYAVSNGATILNNSWGGGGFSSSLEAAITGAKNAGAIFVAASGNSGLNTDLSGNTNYPSGYAVDNVVAVASTTRTDALSSFSNYGATTVDLAAPGSSILSTTPNGTYSTFSGTSMATPHVAGALAVFWDAFPNLTYDEVIEKLLGSVDTLPSLAGKVATGGRLNLDRLLDSVSPPPPPSDTTGPQVTAATFGGSTAGTFDKVRLVFSEAITVGSFSTADVVSLTAPGGGSVAATGVTLVSGSDNTFDVTFGPQSAAGQYSLVVGPAVLDIAGNAMDQNQNGTNGESPADLHTTTGTLYPTRQTFSAGSLPKTITDLATTSVSIVVPASSVVNGFTITDLNVNVTLTHTYTSDLIITLTSPGGKVVTLFNRRGGSGDNLTSTVFDDEATTAISSSTARAPFTGSFKPEAALSGFDGVNPVGTWTLKVQDVARYDVGSIRSVSLGIGTDPSGASAKSMGTADSLSRVSPAMYGGVSVSGAALAVTAPVLNAPPVSVTRPTPLLQVPLADDQTVRVERPSVARPLFEVSGMAATPTAVQWPGLDGW